MLLEVHLGHFLHEGVAPLIVGEVDEVVGVWPSHKSGLVLKVGRLWTKEEWPRPCRMRWLMKSAIRSQVSMSPKSGNSLISPPKHFSKANRPPLAQVGPASHLDIARFRTTAFSPGEQVGDFEQGLQADVEHHPFGANVAGEVAGEVQGGGAQRRARCPWTQSARDWEAIIRYGFS